MEPGRSKQNQAEQNGIILNQAKPSRTRKNQGKTGRIKQNQTERHEEAEPS